MKNMDYNLPQSINYFSNISSKPEQNTANPLEDFIFTIASTRMARCFRPLEDSEITGSESIEIGTLRA
jgi:hypothetical protein